MSRRGRRRAVGPPGAEAGDEPRLDLDRRDDERDQQPESPADEERLRREVPPHHDGER